MGLLLCAMAATAQESSKLVVNTKSGKTFNCKSCHLISPFQ